MGIQDRDYWKDRYNKSESASRPNTMDPQYWQREKPFSGTRHEMSFVAKLVITIVLLLIAAMAYRYQSQIVRLLRPETSTPKPLDVAIQSPAVAPKRPAAADTQSALISPAPSAQIYRCGTNYSHSPCPNAHQVEIPVNQHRDMSATREIYLCKDHYERLTWESVACSANGRFMDRIARVPAHLSWEEQVAVARQQRDRAHAIANEQIVSVAPRATGGKANTSECQSLDERVNWLDSLGRIGGGGYAMDWIREQRRLARDRQFRIGC